ncbi:hypothetical protein BDV59DRAFT_23438 [Aspergillus ambiguus]|uniref:uncharacterized protein n=1 Tax=Aspergillus ambiguus TaxID=176160 RepID=UPI003CCDE793
MESSTLPSSPFPGNRLIAYLQTLTKAKKGLPYGLPVCVALSHTITNSEMLLQLASLVGPHIAILQVHADIVDDWSDETVRQLTSLAKKHAFLIWESGRILNATVDVVGRQKAESREVRNELVDLIRKKYTKGIIKLASWAVMSTAWASGVAVNNQEADILIPTLKAAAREAVADAVQTIRTEITANSNPNERPRTGTDSMEDTDGHVTHHLSSGYAVDENGLGLPPRKASTISLTQTITQHTEDSTNSPLEQQQYEHTDTLGHSGSVDSNMEDGLPSPPLLARGLVLCLPSVNDTSFTADYRRSCIAAARANQDFVVGFLCSEPWHLVSQRDDIFDMDYRGAAEEQQLSPYSSDEEDELPPLALFSLISHRLNSMRGKHLADYTDEDEDTTPTDTNLSAKLVESDNPLATKLFYIVEQAMKIQEASRKEKENMQSTARPDERRKILHIPIVSLP